MILVDSDIRKYIRDGNIEITPFNEAALGSNSYDLTLGDRLITYDRTTPSGHLDCKRENDTTSYYIGGDGGFMLQPGELYLGYTNEFTRAKNTVPLIEGKSSVGRLGIRVHATAGFGDIGFAGHWTLEIDVIRPVIIYAHMPIAQIYFVMAYGTCARPYSLKEDAKYKNQIAEPVPSMMWRNFK